MDKEDLVKKLKELDKKINVFQRIKPYNKSLQILDNYKKLVNKKIGDTKIRNELFDILAEQVIKLDYKATEKFKDEFNKKVNKNKKVIESKLGHIIPKDFTGFTLKEGIGFCGPGTPIITDIFKEPVGKGADKLEDTACKEHDLEYFRAGFYEGDEVDKIVRQADIKLLEDNAKAREELIPVFLKQQKIKKKGSFEKSLLDSFRPFHLDPITEFITNPDAPETNLLDTMKVYTAISAKMILEDAGILDPKAFIVPVKLDDDDRSLMRNKLENFVINTNKELLDKGLITPQKVEEINNKISLDIIDNNDMVKITDPETGEELQQGQIQEIIKDLKKGKKMTGKSNEEITGIANNFVKILRAVKLVKGIKKKGIVPTLTEAIRKNPKLINTISLGLKDLKDTLTAVGQKKFSKTDAKDYIKFLEGLRLITQNKLDFEANRLEAVLPTLTEVQQKQLKEIIGDLKAHRPLPFKLGLTTRKDIQKEIETKMPNLINIDDQISLLSNIQDQASANIHIVKLLDFTPPDDKISVGPLLEQKTPTPEPVAPPALEVKETTRQREDREVGEAVNSFVESVLSSAGLSKPTQAEQQEIDAIEKAKQASFNAQITDTMQEKEKAKLDAMRDLRPFMMVGGPEIVEETEVQQLEDANYIAEFDWFNQSDEYVSGEKDCIYQSVKFNEMLRFSGKKYFPDFVKPKKPMTPTLREKLQVNLTSEIQHRQDPIKDLGQRPNERPPLNVSLFQEGLTQKFVLPRNYGTNNRLIFSNRIDGRYA